jgi:hypothetical protein
MSTLPNTYDFLETIIMEHGMRIQSVIPDKNRDSLTILLMNGHTLKTPLSKYIKLFNATDKEPSNYMIIADGN